MAIKKETAIVNKIKKYLSDFEEAYFFKIHGGPMQMAGISDLIGIYKGRFVAIEIKTPENKKGVTKLQKKFIDKINSCGGLGFVACSVQEVEENLICTTQITQD